MFIPTQIDHHDHSNRMTYLLLVSSILILRSSHTVSDGPIVADTFIVYVISASKVSSNFLINDKALPTFLLLSDFYFNKNVTIIQAQVSSVSSFSQISSLRHNSSTHCFLTVNSGTLPCRLPPLVSSRTPDLIHYSTRCPREVF